MKRISRIATLAIAIVAALPTLTAQDAVYNLIRKTYTVSDNGTVDIRYRKEITLLRNRAITAYADKGETFILYNPAIDQLTVNESYTLRPDGSKVQTPPNAFIDQLPSQCADCGRYNGIRERVVAHTALEYNCTIVLDYTIRRKTDFLDETIVFGEDCPVKKYEVVVDVKDNTMKFNYSKNLPASSDAKKVKFLNDGHALHVVASNLQQNYVDNYLPGVDELYPSVSITFGTSATDTYNIERLPEADALIAELHEKDPLLWATNIRDYVVDNIHTNNIPANLVAHQVAAAATTFASSCGTPQDKTRMLAAILRQAGFNATTDGDAVLCDIKNGNDVVTYRLSATNKRSPRPVDDAIDEQRTIDVSEDLIWNGTNIGDGYAQMTLPTTSGSVNIDPARLAADRKAPLKVRNCNEKYHYAIVLPRTPKRILASKPVDINYSVKGLGSIKVSIQQDNGGGIVVVRELIIDVKDGIVTPKQYKDFRKMMQDWNCHNTITVKTSNTTH